MKITNQKYKNNKKRAFTTAEAFVALTIISIVIAASVPMVTVKQKQGISSDATNNAWGVSRVATGKGLITKNPVVLGTNPVDGNGNRVITFSSITTDASGIPTVGDNKSASLSYRLVNDDDWPAERYPGSLLNMITANRPFFRVGNYDFSQIRDNIFITAVGQDADHHIVTNIPNIPDEIYGPNQDAKTCFNTDTDDCARNIFLGGTNFNDNVASPINNILHYATTNFSDNTIIGNGNKNISNTSAGSLIAGFSNNAGGDLRTVGAVPADNDTTVTIVGNGNVAQADNQVIIGNGITAPATTDFINIGNANDAGKPLIAANANMVTFNKPTIVDGDIKASAINLTSDKRLKNIKGEYKKGLAEVLKVEPILYTLKSDATNEVQVGVIAQELQKIFPEAVVTMPNGFLGVDVTPVFFATLNAINELNQKTQYEKERTKRLRAEYLALTGGEKKVGFGGKIKAFLVKVKNKLHI